MSRLFFMSAIPMAAAGIGASVIIVPNTIGLQKGKKFLHLYKDGIPVPLQSCIHQLFLDVKSDLIDAKGLEAYDISTDRLNEIKPFTVFGFDVYRLGWLGTSYGGLLGVPEYFSSCNKEKGRTTGIRVGSEPIDWDTPEGKKLLESFQISEEAKKFALARETLHLCNNENTWNTVIYSWNALFGSTMAVAFYYKLKEKKLPRLLQGFFFSMVAVFSITLWASMKDMRTVTSEKDVDAALCALGVNYAVGGTEYYYSLLKRNMALRTLRGSSGEKRYTALGNENALVRQKHAPLVERAEFCRARLQEYVDQQKAEAT